MTSQEVTTYNKMSDDELMALTGQSTGKRFENFPRVALNKGGEDDMGRQTPAGYFKISQGGVVVFGKPITFRPFINAYQYAVYDSESERFINRSIIFKNFNEEALDELGGVACGKISKKKQQNLSLTPAQIEEQKKIKCYRILYGLASFNGVTADNEKQTIVELPVTMRLSGDNFMDIGGVLDSLASKKILMLSTNLELTTTRKKQGTNVWYHLEAKPDLENFVKLDDNAWSQLKDFQAAIDIENQSVIKKHSAVRRGQIRETEAIEVAQTLSDELNDDISDLGR